MTKKSLLTILLVPSFLLLIPLVANQTVDGFNWNPGAFIFLWVLLVGIGLAYKLVTNKTGSVAHRVATGLALATAFMVFWGNLAVGFVGSEDNPANLMYGGVLAIGLIGAAIARFSSAGMAQTMAAMACGQFLVPIVALLVRPHDFSPGVAQVFALNFVFVLLFGVSAWLFRYASHRPRKADGPMTA
ncbi:MAG: hypothetical protein QM715_19065 [Nibricoccus sp.]